MISCFIALSSFAQYNDVTLKVNGNKNRKVVLDDRTYTMTNTNARANNKNITIKDLQPGKHTIQVFRTNKATNTTVTTFTLRNGYDAIITVNGTGAVQVREKKRATASTGNTPMTATAFNALQQEVNKQWQADAKLNMINSAFTNTNNFFTTSQAMQLIKLVDAEDSRLQLAKASYRSITDAANFRNIATLLNDQSSKNELQSYVNNYNNPVTTSGNGAMNSSNFNTLLQDIQSQWQTGAKQNMINNVFSNTSNYFTAAQARQLIQTVDAEESRLQLAKVSYRSIVDRENFSTVSALLSNKVSRNELSLYVNDYNNTTVTTAHVAMNAAAFANLLKDVQAQWQSGAKLNMLMSTFNGANYFTATQVRQLVQTVDAESSRLQLAKAAYKTVTDPSNFSVVSELLEAQASRNDLAAYIRNGGEVIATVPTGNTTMSDAGFQSIIDNLNAQWIPGTKMMMLQDVFANTANYFSSAQVKQLVAFVSVEANRLQLLKASYKSVTDRSNFSTTYELLATQASRDDLLKYIQAYTGS